MSGGLLDCSASGILVVNCSFWIGTFLIVTFGCAAWNELAMLCHTPRRGWVVPLFHQVRVTLPVELLDPLEVLELPPHAATAVAVVTAIAMAANARLLRMFGHLPKVLATLSTCRHRRIADLRRSTLRFHCVTDFFAVLYRRF